MNCRRKSNRTTSRLISMGKSRVDSRTIKRVILRQILISSRKVRLTKQGTQIRHLIRIATGRSLKGQNGRINMMTGSNVSENRD
jgi:hypothetical protein